MFPIEAGTDAAIPARASPAMSPSRSTLAMLATGMGTDASFDSGANGTRVAPASEINLSPLRCSSGGFIVSSSTTMHLNSFDVLCSSNLHSPRLRGEQSQLSHLPPSPQLHSRSWGVIEASPPTVNKQAG
ncbi:hypothetical protein VE00_08664 [Pseudogymnoascus sp. WSF 3629]|nr:hypothetical protein VE00_08664 [Pseudogymnoascus sp. WSF 3629]